MDTSQVSDVVHKNSRKFVELKTQVGEMQVNQDTIEALLSQIVVLPKDTLTQIGEFIEKNSRLGFASKEDFLKDAARFRMRYLSQEYEHVELLREKYDRGERLIQEAGMPFLGVADYLEQQLDALLKKYEEWESRRKK